MQVVFDFIQNYLLNNPDLSHALRGFETVIFFVVFGLGLASTLRRVGRFRLHHVRIPIALKRDAINQSGLGCVLLLGLAASYLGLMLSNSPLWILIQGAILIFAFGTYTFVDYFVVGKDEREREEGREGVAVHLQRQAEQDNEAAGIALHEIEREREE